MPSLYDPPPTKLNPLTNPDGSATHTAHGYTVTAAANGPLEVSRRDELPEEAALEVNVRPAVGVGGTSHQSLSVRNE
jgi:exosome complex component RRP46